MFTSESLTQVFLFVLRTLTKTPEQFLRLRYLGYDRACALEPFLKNQKNGSAGAKLLLEHVKFLVDIFHVAKHTEEACMPPTNANCWYHPHLKRFEEIHGVNTESCEQGFKRLNIYFNLTRKMTQFKRNILFWHVNNCFNVNLEDERRAKGLMYTISSLEYILCTIYYYLQACFVIVGINWSTLVLKGTTVTVSRADTI